MPPEFVALVRQACTHLGLVAQEADQVVQTGCLRLDDVVFVLHLRAQASQLEILGDGGLPAPHQELELQRHLLAQALTEELPGLTWGLHPVSGHVVARGLLFMPAIDDEGWLLVGLLLAAAERIHDLRERFTLLPEGIR